MGSLRDLRADEAAEAREKAASDAIGYDVGSASAPRPGELMARGAVADAAPTTTYVDPNDPVAMREYERQTGDVPRAPSVGVPGPAATPQSKVAGGVHQAISLSKWQQMADQVRAKYPGVAKRLDQAAGVAKQMAPALPGFGGTAAAIGNAATAEKKPGAPEEAKAGDDGAQALSDRAKTLAGDGGMVADLRTGGASAFGGGAPVRTIPGHWQDATRVTKESQLTPEDAESVRTSEQSAQGHQAEGLQHADEAAKQQAFAQQSFNRWSNEFARQNAAEMQAAAAQRDKLVGQRLAALDDSMSRYDASVNDLSKARSGLFANKVANAPAAATAIFGILSLGVGTLAAISGRQNPIQQAIEMMDNSVQKDIDAQEKIVDAAGHRVGLARNALGDAYRTLGDKDAARAAVAEAQYKYAAAQADMMSGQAKDEETKAKLSEMKAAFMDKAAESRAKVAQLTNAQVTRDERYVPKQTVGGVGGAGAGYLDTTPGHIVGLPSGGEVAVRSEKAQQAITDRQAMEKNLGRSLSKLQKLDEGASYADHINPMSEYHRQRERLVAQIIPQVSQAQDKSVVRSGEEERIEKATGGNFGIVDKFMGRKPLAGEAAKGLEGGSEEMINAQHGVRVQEVLVQNPKTGKIEQKYIPIQQDVSARPPVPSSLRKVK